MDLNNLKKPENKEVLAKKPQRGRRPGRKLSATIRLGLTEPEMNKIVELSEKHGTSYSATIRSILRERGYI